MTQGKTRKYSIKELAQITASTFTGDENHIILGVDSLEYAEECDASFLANPRYQDLIRNSKAGVICISPLVTPEPGKNYLISDNPSRTFQTIIELFLVDENNKSGFLGIHPTAVIHPTAKIGANVEIGPYAVIDQNCTVGDKTRIMAHVCICSGSVIGEECLIYPHVVIREKSEIGNKVILQPSVTVGSCGFGFTTDAKGHHSKLEQLGNVVIEDDVEIGSHTTIDRARFKSTKISQNTKIDNLVQIAHNVQIGPSNIIVSQTGIAGSSKTGRNVVIGGQAGIVGHIEICDRVMIATRGGVSKNMTEPGKYAGAPVMPLAEYNRQQVHLRKIDEYVKKIISLEKRISELEKN
ncbi:MAG: UDP-3-O-(3-hydroxymyristoyl)glucosamine N-acyltransferase [Chlamydiae bacterium]|nr:UDP-3-O-(3-hydroxymyristoyl)glucosamine N-acyltransferase [Chlamydiota bacterium]